MPIWQNSTWAIFNFFNRVEEISAFCYELLDVLFFLYNWRYKSKTKKKLILA